MGSHRRWRRRSQTDDGQVALDDPSSPSAPDAILARCEEFLVDEACGRSVGVVRRVGPTELEVVQGWRRRPMQVPINDLVEIDPEDRRLIITCQHAPPAA